MSKVKIYVEGDNDRVVISDFLEKVLGINISVIGSSKNTIFAFSRNNIEGEILTLGGWGNIRKPMNINDFKENTSNGIKNIIILDADSISNGGKFNIRQTDVEDTKAEFGLSFEYFLMPNNQDDGSIDTFLREIIKVEVKPILDCLDENDNCLREAQKKSGREMNLPNGKAKINYFKTLLKDKGNDYKNETIWDWKHPYLNSLKQFLEQHLV